MNTITKGMSINADFEGVIQEMEAQDKNKTVNIPILNAPMMSDEKWQALTEEQNAIEKAIEKAAKEIVSYREAVQRLQKEVDYLNLPNWDNESEIFSGERYDEAIHTAYKMIEMYNILCPDEQLELDVNEDTEKWQLIPIMTKEC